MHAQAVVTDTSQRNQYSGSSTTLDELGTLVLTDCHLAVNHGLGLAQQHCRAAVRPMLAIAHAAAPAGAADRGAL
jgi:hypothetical protein